MIPMPTTATATTSTTTTIMTMAVRWSRRWPTRLPPMAQEANN